MIRSHFFADRKRNGGLLLMSLLLVFTPMSVGAQELQFVGFDRNSHSSAAHEGLLEIFSGRLFHAGMPLSAIKALSQAAGPQVGKPKESAAPSEYYATSKMPSPKSRKGNLPLGDSVHVRGGVQLVSFNCFACHAGVVHGRVVAGLPNNRVIPSNKTPEPDAATIKRILPKLTEPERKELQEFLSNSIGHLQLPQSSSRGDNFGPYAVWDAIAHLADPERTGLLRSDEKTEMVKLLESVKLPGVDPMPWWLIKYKKKNYWYSDGGIYDAAHFSVNFTTRHSDVNAERAAHVESTRRALAFARETHSPAFPKSLDAKLVKQGADLFHGRTRPINRKGFTSCKTCHGTYTKKEGTDYAKPGSWNVDYRGSETLRVVGTDATYSNVLRQIRPIAERTNKLAAYYKAKGTPELTPRFTAPNKRGYVAPPLVGVWASAPYFHNGSVPTVEAVLNSKSRPKIWLRNLSDPHAYDVKNLGLKYQRLTRSEFEAQASLAAAKKNPISKAVIDYQAIYDTESYGHGNSGHTFGDGLSDGERRAVIEFLKSLSGPDM